VFKTYPIKLQSFVDVFGLRLLTPEVDISDIVIKYAEVGRPGLAFAGFYEHFPDERVQVLGMSESAFVKQLGKEVRRNVLSKFFSREIPCVILSEDAFPLQESLEIATENKVPVFAYTGTTSELLSEALRWLRVELAPRTTMHGVLVDVYGEGVLILGKSGVGKSETALELVKRGHRLVSDDVVEIKRVSQETLFGSAPERTRHLIELRGIGIVDIKELYGVGSVKMTQGITLVINLVQWDENAKYERIGLRDDYIDILGNSVVCHTIPVRPGRNIAIICESAAINYRQKQLGYNAAKVLADRIENNFNHSTSFITEER
jgi:HPr kinase/phosphorylase